MDDFSVDYFYPRTFRIWFKHVADTLDPKKESPWWTGLGTSAQTVAEDVVCRYAEEEGLGSTVDLIMHDTGRDEWHEMTFANRGWQISTHQVGGPELCDRSTK